MLAKCWLSVTVGDPALHGVKWILLYVAFSKNVSSPSTCESQYYGEPPWPRGSVLGLRPPGLEFRILCLRTVSSQSHHPQEVLLVQFSLYVHRGGLKPDSFHFTSLSVHSWQYHDRRKPEVGTMPYSYRMTWVLYRQGYFIVHSTIDNTAYSRPLNSLEHCRYTTSMANIRPDRDSNPVPLSFKPQPDRISHWDRPKRSQINLHITKSFSITILQLFDFSNYDLFYFYHHDQRVYDIIGYLHFSELFATKRDRKLLLRILFQVDIFTIIIRGQNKSHILIQESLDN